MLECWNIGKMGSGIMRFWVNGKICVEDKTKNGSYPSKNQYSIIPTFHYSISQIYGNKTF